MPMMTLGIIRGAIARIIRELGSLALINRRLRHAILHAQIPAEDPTGAEDPAAMPAWQDVLRLPILISARSLPVRLRPLEPRLWLDNAERLILSKVVLTAVSADI